MFAVYVKNLHVHDIKRHAKLPLIPSQYSLLHMDYLMHTLNQHACVVFHLNRTLQLLDPFRI